VNSAGFAGVLNELMSQVMSQVMSQTLAQTGADRIWHNARFP